MVRICIFCSIVIGFFSCAEYKHVSIQTLNPSPVIVPRNFNKPKLVLSYYEGIKGDLESMARASFDSLAGREAIETLFYELKDSPWFSDVPITTSFYIKNDVSPFINPFAWDTVEKICNTDTSDLLISLEYINVRPVFDSYSYYDNFAKYYFGSITNYIYAFWRIYDLNSRKIYGDYLFRDTIIWEKADFMPITMGNQLPGLFQTASYSGYLIGKNYSSQIAPFWSDEKRIFYVGNKELRKANKFVSTDDWLAAARVWQDLYSKRGIKPEIAAKAAFNLALANEMYGNFDVSLQWLDKSKELWFLPYQAIYQNIITDRLKKTLLLKSN